MTLSETLTAIALAVAASASFADTFTGAINLSSGNAFFGRNDTVETFTDTYTFTLGSSFSISGQRPQLLTALRTSISRA